jgi:DNA-binding response OmpR family regulator
MNTVLIITHEEDLYADLSRELVKRGYIVRKNTLEGETLDRDLTDASLIMLDLGASDSANKDAITMILKKTGVPLFVCSKEKSEIVKSYYLDLGADGYITHPIPVIETGARIKSVLRRFDAFSNPKEKKAYKIGPFHISLSEYSVMKNGSPVKLTAREFSILKLFLENKGSVVSRDRIIQNVYPWDDAATDNALNIQINRLRKKLSVSKNTSLIETVWGIGYRFNSDVPDQ